MNLNIQLLILQHPELLELSKKMMDAAESNYQEEFYKLCDQFCELALNQLGVKISREDLVFAILNAVLVAAVMDFGGRLNGQRLN